MNYCKKCGSIIPEGQTKCPNCYTDPTVSVEQKLTDFGEKVKATAQDTLESVADRTAEFDTADITANRAMAILSYFSWLCLIPIFCAKESPYARFHANQGLILAIVGMVAVFAVGIISAILPNFFILNLIVKLLDFVVKLAILALAIIGIVNAAKDKAKELPVIGGFQILK